jgi:hypothetical protein
MEGKPRQHLSQWPNRLFNISVRSSLKQHDKATVSRIFVNVDRLLHDKIEEKSHSSHSDILLCFLLLKCRKFDVSIKLCQFKKVTKPVNFSIFSWILHQYKSLVRMQLRALND